MQCSLRARLCPWRRTIDRVCCRGQGTTTGMLLTTLSAPNKQIILTFLLQVNPGKVSCLHARPSAVYEYLSSFRFHSFSRRRWLDHTTTCLWTIRFPATCYASQRLCVCSPANASPTRSSTRLCGTQVSPLCPQPEIEIRGDLSPRVVCGG
jgi:hypothetical protein